MQVSYLIVDLADTDLEMANDPFLEAGITVPEELPYSSNPNSVAIKRKNPVKKQKSTMVKLASARNSLSVAENGDADASFNSTPDLGRSRKLSGEDKVDCTFLDDF